MNDIFAISDLLLSHSDNLSSLLIIAAIMAAIIIGISEHKKRLWSYIVNRRNRVWFAYLFLMLALILFLRNGGYIFGGWLVIVSVAWVLYAAACFLSLAPKRFTGYNSIVLRKYEKWLRDGSAIEHIDYFRRPKHWYLCSAEDKLEYHMLACQCFDDIKEFENALKELDKIDDAWLYESEKRIIKLQRALLLAQLGSMKAAYHLLGDPDENKSEDPMVWFTYSFIYENAGDIDKALIYAEKSRDIVDAGYKAPDFVIAEIYNNYARVAIFKGNRQEALHYLDIAWRKVKNSKDMRTIHVVASNRIAQMAMAGRSEAECEAALEEYNKCIPNDSFANRIEYNNCAILLYRQLKNAKRENSILKSGFKDIIGQLNHTQAVVYTASTFRMIMNARFDHGWFDRYVKAGSEEYKNLPLLEKLAVFKEYMGIYQQEEFLAVFSKAPYLGLQKKIMKYYRDSALTEIDAALNKVEPYNMHLYRNLMKHKLSILKLVEGKNHIDRSKDTYISLYKQLYDAGLHLDAADILMTLIDECTSAYNVLIYRPFWLNAVYYCDYIANAPQPPPPEPDVDGLHLKYYRLGIAGPYAIKPLKVDVIEEHIDTLMSEVRSWKHHPFKVELSIGIARVLMCLERRDEAKEFYQIFKDSGMAETQMAAWARNSIAALEAEFPGETGQ